jgi:transposase-like protein
VNLQQKSLRKGVSKALLNQYVIMTSGIAAMRSTLWQDINNPEAVAKKGREGRRNRLKGARGRSTLEKEKPPIFGMIQRCGQVVIQMLANVRQATIEPLIRATVSPGTLIYTDEYGIYARLDEWGCGHKSVNHGAGEYAREEDETVL